MLNTKKTKAEVQELFQQFEQTLKELHHQRFAHDAKFYCQELYCVRLQLALMQSVEDNHVHKQLLNLSDEAHLKLEAADDKLGTFRDKVLSMKELQEERVREEKEMASPHLFRQQFAQSGLEADAVTALLQIFRRRRDVHKDARKHTAGVTLSPDPDGRRGISKQLSSTNHANFRERFNALPAPDPYPDLGVSADVTEGQPSNEDEHIEECPEGVDEASFQRMLELRRDRLHAEQEIQKGNAVLQEMNGLLSHLQKERDDAQDALSQVETELAEHLNLMGRERYDIEILFKLKQGQVEVPQAAVVTDYSDAIVIDQEVVESRNRRILELGKEKIGTLETTKEFRKKLNLAEWELKKLQLQKVDLEERTKEVHMLRVTKELQSVLKGGEETRNKADADLLERKIEHLGTTTQQKEQSLKKQYAMGSQSTKLRKMENGMLEKKLRELQQNVIQREHIRRLRAPQGGGTGGTSGKDGERPRIMGGGGRIEENEAAIRAAQQGFREVQTRQNLMETAKKNRAEIELLNKELVRLRQRTFPSFVQLHEGRPSNPDHYR